MSTFPDAVIVGQGLAGTVLAWTLLDRGAHIIIADAGHPGASAVAAGLVTPVTGQALRSQPDFHRDRDIAARHYKKVERILNRPVWRERAALRVADHKKQAMRLDQRLSESGSGLSHCEVRPAPGLHNVLGVALMPQAARLDVAAYVRHSAAEFRRRGILRSISIEPQHVAIHPDGHVEAGGLIARHLVWCRGFYDHNNPWLAQDALSPAKGEIIDLHVPDWREPRVIHCGGHWLLPGETANTLSFGATYDHHDLCPHPTATARQQLARRASELLSVEFEITGQRAGIRPVGADRRPICGAHPVHRQILTLNGLGSKGVLWAPRLAQALSDTLLGAASMGKP